MTPDERKGGELLPCPFCGGPNVAQGLDGDGNISVWCMDCDARGPTTRAPEFGDMKREIASCQYDWNRRAAHEKIASMREGHEELFEQIDKWAEAYPTDIFPEVPKEDWLRVRKALEDAGLSLDRVSASNMRHVVTRIKELADKVRALKC